jgi:hypothetical protein
MTITELFESKKYVTDGGIQYRTPQEYVRPFIELFGDTVDFVVETAEKVVNANEDSIENTAYGKVLVKGQFPSVEIALRNGNKETILPSVGMLYSVGSQKPTAKIYAGFDVQICMNMTVFNAEMLHSLSLNEDIKPLYERAGTFVAHIQKLVEDAERFIRNLDNKSFTPATLNEFLGNLLKKSIKNPKLGVNSITGMTKSLVTNSSRYFVGTKFENNSYWNVFNALTESVGRSDLYERPSKILSYSQYFN